jgi:hypothetical protein
VVILREKERKKARERTKYSKTRAMMGGDRESEGE